VIEIIGRGAIEKLGLQSGRTRVAKPPLPIKPEGSVRIPTLIAAEELDPATTAIQIHTIVAR